MPELELSQQGHILLVTLNRPDIHNAISHTEMVQELVDVCERVNQDDDIRVMVITGAGRSFCAGGNIKDMHTKKDMFSGTEAELALAYQNGIQRIPIALWQVGVPVIAAVNGPAIGAGCDLAMMCDIRLASDNARFAESFVKLGIIPGDGGAWFLPRVIGSARAAHMTLTGDSVDAQTAKDWGMVSEVVSAEALLPRAIELAETIASNPPIAVKEAKKLLRISSEIALPEMLETCAQVQSSLHQTDDHAEAVDAFINKRPGQFHGK